MNTFEMKTVIHFGENALERLKDIPYKRVLIITDPFVVQSKMIDLITEPLTRGGKEYDIFHNVVPDAPVDKIADGVKKFLSFQRRSDRPAGRCGSLPLRDRPSPDLCINQQTPSRRQYMPEMLRYDPSTAALTISSIV